MRDLQKKNFPHIDGTLIGMIIAMLAGYLLFHDLIGKTLFYHSSWDSYTLQAMAWREGSVGLGQNYPWLELAIYKGDWFVSFPPLPSVVLFPLTLIFGINTPNNLLVALYGVISAAIIYNCLKKVNITRYFAAFTAVFLVWGSNLMWMTTNGGVWFQAQALNFLLLSAAVHCVLSNRRIAAYALVALAVGCRPFSIVYFLPILVIFYLRDKKAHCSESFFKLVSRQLTCLIFPAIFAAALMWYNYIRFDSILEFGHNYLPEFLEAPSGQFNFEYIGINLYNVFLRPISLTATGGLEYPIFDGFMFYIANPILLILFIGIVRDAIKKGMNAEKITILIALALNLLLLCAHKTFGGWQFGARYTVDMIPFAFLYLIYNGKPKINALVFTIMTIGIMLNIYGALAMNILYNS